MFPAIKQIHDKLDSIIRILTKKKPAVDRQFLIVYHWANDITGASGDSSLIITIPAGEKMNAERIRELQPDILNQVNRAGHPNDPTDVVVTGFYKLEV